MPIDDDLVKADLVLAELPRARQEILERSIPIVRHLAISTRNNGSRALDIENAQADAWLSICAIGQTLERTQNCPSDVGQGHHPRAALAALLTERS